MSKKYEDYGFVLDFLPEGHPEEQKPAQFREPIVQILGEEHLPLLEAVPRENVTISPQDRVYIGKKGRKEIERVKRRIGYDQLTSASKAELPVVIKNIIKNNEEKYLKFFNEASPITSRYHQFELIPGIGKKLMWAIIEEREKKPFESFEDLKKRVKSLPDPKKMLAKRIEKELQGEGKYSLFARPPKKERGGEGYSR
ncbi:hypothetical protein AKJ37_00355 [candidate division MSBL1 archaeon SCGC-AAA259I09]|uniref:Uncharacterized protein n=2 Tax=candidate division MSBL1 TaxID=215777 RepID=A0A133UTK9_9EURY|nr:hypothetical protein AKJ38_01065 [candidate division MSBL1 archaeon SCGC-AAA259I14]KXA98352.1 hypothetical protein AKJ37_00355 [candidate division MSBL1 archaeon SCGC-AAA259I09]